ncbi:MAG TPA: preprotein translocase subunit SecG [Kiritimatiellia bacterium]|nr:preprotein translocase subunit SecG [Kiritimatiellia bacterium]HMO51429.1 preprotein translocase subunit SecG [Kiritimatiellia bacterium]HMO97854.1 preprotein translocase subunit SecG [Kiritimatiellia bacterium]HMP97502.1 preprotein translocase subunit SecG [Kiritimatiellia bacterium]
MEILRYVLIVVEVLVCLLLIGVILLQQSKSQGMGLAFGGGMGETLFGSRAGNVLTKLTVILALVFLANTTLLGILYTTKQERSLVDSARAPAPAPLPVSPTAPVGQELMTTPPQQPAAPMLSVEDVPVDASSFPGFSSDTVIIPGDAGADIQIMEEAPIVSEFEDVAVQDAPPVEEPGLEPGDAEPVSP